MAGMVLPYFKMFAAETLSDGRFQGWSVEERGAWITLLCVQWREGAIPSDLTSLAKLLHVDSSAMRSLWSSIGDRFVQHPDFPGMLASPRMEEEREEALASVNQKKRAGKLGAESRWSKAKRPNGTAIAPPCGGIADPMADDGDQINATQPNADHPKRAARVGVGHPAFEAIEHWTKTVWPRVSPAPCAPVNASQAQSLSGLAERYGMAEVLGAMDRAAADPFWADKIDLDGLIGKFPRFVTRNEQPKKRNERGIQPVGQDWNAKLEV